MKDSEKNFGAAFTSLSVLGVGKISLSVAVKHLFENVKRKYSVVAQISSLASKVSSKSHSKCFVIGAV